MSDTPHLTTKFTFSGSDKFTKGFLRWCATIALLVCAQVAPGFSQAKIRLTEPKSGSKVSSLEVFTGQAVRGGQPFILVRAAARKPATSKASWWVQKNVLIDDTGRFRGEVHFGNTITADKTRFEAVAIFITDPKVAVALRKAYSVPAIPRSVIKTRANTYTFDKSKEKSKPLGFVLHPRPNDLVGRHDFLIGRVPKFGTPVIFVRAEGSRDWWIQNVASTVPDGGFKSDLYFGNENTPDHTRFEVAVVVVDPSATDQFKKGRIANDLPLDHLGLQRVVVELDHEITLKNANARVKTRSLTNRQSP